MAREKYVPAYDYLADACFWVHWLDGNGNLHHTLRSLSAIIPADARFVLLRNPTEAELDE
tara:strand:+ start:973 stop:1152 length:180 start_codon:yes stop_codon:yes gene_type:complete